MRNISDKLGRPRPRPARSGHHAPGSRRVFLCRLRHGWQAGFPPRNREMTDTPEASDLLYGSRAIARYLGLTERQAAHRIAAGVIPHFKIEGTVCARKA